MRIQDLVELARQRGVEVPWNVQRRKEDVIQFLRERNIQIPEKAVLSREELLREARRLNVPNQSLLRTKCTLERAIQKAKSKQRVSLSRRRTSSWSLPLEPPREQPVSILDQTFRTFLFKSFAQKLFLFLRLKLREFSKEL